MTLPEPAMIGECVARAAASLGVALDSGADQRSPAGWVAAARKAGLVASVEAAPLHAPLPKGTQVAVAILSEGRATVIKGGLKNGRWVVAVPKPGGDEGPMPEAIAAQYLGFLMLFKKATGRERDRGHRSAANGEEGRGRGGRWLWAGLGRLKGELPFVMVASVVIHLVALGIPLITMVMYDRVVPNRAFETLWTVTLGGLALFGFDFVVRLLRGRFADVAGKAADQSLSSGLVDQLLTMEVAARPASAGGFAAKLRQYESVREFLTSAVLVSFVDAPVAFLLTGLIFWLGGAVGWIPVVLSGVALAVTLLLQPWQRRLMKASFAMNIDRQALTVEVVNGLETIKAANAEAETGRRLREMERECAQSDLKMRRVNLLGNSVTVLCMNLTTLGVLVGCVHRILEQEMTMGAMIACSMVAGRAMAPLVGMAGLLLRLQQTVASLKALIGIMELPREDGKTLLNLALRWPNFQLERVGVTYGGHPLASLKDVSLRIAAGERVGVIGRAGSGKTTLLRLFSRLLLPTEGLLLVDGVDVRQIQPSRIREVCGYLPQDPVLFHGSVRENILLGRSPDVSDQAFMKAAQRAGLLEWVNRHPSGFDLPVGERGILLSGGQRQAVAAARVLLTEPDCLFLDEPAANFDLTSEKLFREELRSYLNERPKRTLVLATHKMSLLSLVDRVIVIDAGKVVADGPREEILNQLKSGGAASAKAGAAMEPQPVQAT